MNKLELLLLLVAALFVAYADRHFREQSALREAALNERLELAERAELLARDDRALLKEKMRGELDALAAAIEAKESEVNRERERRVEIEEKYKEQREKWKDIYRDAKDCDQRIKAAESKMRDSVDIKCLTVNRDLIQCQEHVRKLRRDWSIEAQQKQMCHERHQTLLRSMGIPDRVRARALAEARERDAKDDDHHASGANANANVNTDADADARSNSGSRSMAEVRRREVLAELKRGDANELASLSDDERARRIQRLLDDEPRAQAEQALKRGASAPPRFSAGAYINEIERRRVDEEHLRAVEAQRTPENRALEAARRSQARSGEMAQQQAQLQAMLREQQARERAEQEARAAAAKQQQQQKQQQQPPDAAATTADEQAEQPSSSSSSSSPPPPPRVDTPPPDMSSMQAAQQLAAATQAARAQRQSATMSEQIAAMSVAAKQKQVERDREQQLQQESKREEL